MPGAAERGDDVKCNDRTYGYRYGYRTPKCKPEPRIIIRFIPAAPGHPVSVQDALDAHPDLPPLLALAATHRPIFEVLGLRGASSPPPK